MWKTFYIESWPTLLGGYCTAIFACFVLSIGLFLSLGFQFGNIVEQRSLLPAAAIDPAARAAYRTDMQLTARFVIYGQNCQANTAAAAVNTWGACDAGVNVTLVALRPDVTDAQYQQCRYDTAAAVCEVRVTCKSCQVQADVSSVLFVLSQTLSYAQTIQWRLALTTGVQTFAADHVPGGQLSQLASQVAAQGNTIFRGNTPSQVVVSLFPSNYAPTVYGLVPGTGMVASLLTTIAGSTTPTSLFSQSNGLRFELVFQRQTASFVTSQIARLSPEQSFAQIMGLSVGAFMLLRWAMRALESWLERPSNWGVFHDSRGDRRLDAQDEEDKKRHAELVKARLEGWVAEPKLRSSEGDEA